MGNCIDQGNRPMQGIVDLDIYRKFISRCNKQSTIYIMIPNCASLFINRVPRRRTCGSYFYILQRSPVLLCTDNRIVLVGTVLALQIIHLGAHWAMEVLYLQDQVAMVVVKVQQAYW